MLGGQVTAATLAGNERLALVARFGVGYDNVDVAACTATGVFLTITPEAVRRPMAVVNLTFILALAGRLLEQDTLTRRGTLGGQAIGSRHRLGRQNARHPRLRAHRAGDASPSAKPLGMRHIAFDPYANPRAAADPRRRAGRSRDLAAPVRFPRRRRGADAGDAPHHQRRAAGDDEADRLSDQHGARPARRSAGALRGAARQADRRRGAGRLRAGAGRSRRSDSHAAERDRHSPRALLDGRVRDDDGADRPASRFRRSPAGKAPRNAVNPEAAEHPALREKLRRFAARTGA